MRPITILDVLTHVSGIQKPATGASTLAEAVAAYAMLPLDFEPGTAVAVPDGRDEPRRTRRRGRLRNAL